jgi:hypothetical protein
MSSNFGSMTVCDAEMDPRGLIVGVAALCVAACLVLVTSAFAVDAARTAISQGAYAAAIAADGSVALDGIGSDI